VKYKYRFLDERYMLISIKIEGAVAMPYFPIVIAKDRDWHPQSAVLFIKSLLNRFGGKEMYLELQIEAWRGHIVWGVTVTHGEISERQMTTLVKTFYPEAEVGYVDWEYPEFPCFYKGIVLRRPPGSEPIIPLTNAKNIKPASDPLLQISQAMDNLEAGEVLGLRIFITSQAEYRVSDWERFVKVVLEAAEKELRRNNPWRIDFPRQTTLEEILIKNKLAEPLYTCQIAVQISSPEPDRTQIADTVVGILSAFNWPPFIALNYTSEDEQVLYDEVDYAPDQYTNVIDLMSKDEFLASRYFLTAEEIASLWHLPYEDFKAKGIPWTIRESASLPPLLREVRGLFLGMNRGEEVHQPIDERTQHTIVIGKPGTGKSSLLHRMVDSDIKAGLGLCVIDPHGTLIRDILQHSVPLERENDVVVLDFANENNPPPLNPLYHPAGVSEDIAADMITQVMTSLYDDFAGKEMAETLSTALYTLTSEIQPTLRDVMRLLEDEEYREELVAKLDDDVAANFWKRFSLYSEGRRSEMIRPILWRLNPFYRNKALRMIACHPNPIDLRKLIKENKVILISLAADEAKMPSDQRNLLGAVIVSQIQMAVMAGAIQQKPFLLYVDEAQNFISTGLPKMLTEARKQGLGLILANQYLRQLAGDTLEAVEGTVGTMLCFEVGEPDAKAFAPYMRPQFEVADLVALGKFRAAVSMRYRDSRQPAFRLDTLQPPHTEDNTAQKREIYLREQSVATYTPMTYSEVNEWLRKRYNPEKNTLHTTDGSVDGSRDDNEFIEPKNST
jgi:hypothetical protein